MSVQQTAWKTVKIPAAAYRELRALQQRLRMHGRIALPTGAELDGGSGLGEIMEQGVALVAHMLQRPPR